jgi:hypothetical protein
LANFELPDAIQLTALRNAEITKMIKIAFTSFGIFVVSEIKEEVRLLENEPIQLLNK